MSPDCMPNDTVKLAPTQTLKIISSTPEALEIESIWDAGGSPPRRHFHPRQEEHFEVLSGELTVLLGDSPARVLDAGESLAVPRGVTHGMWNAGSEPTHASWRITPGLRTEEMFRFIDAGMGPVRSVIMLLRFRNEFRLPRPGQ